jgi:hypothetical protein
MLEATIPLNVEPFPQIPILQQFSNLFQVHSLRSRPSEILLSSPSDGGYLAFSISHLDPLATTIGLDVGFILSEARFTHWNSPERSQYGEEITGAKL